jgi:hypothetical protein
VRVEENWRLLAESVNALADHIGNSVGYAFVPVTFADLPPAPQAGMLCCISDSPSDTWGAVITSGVGAPPGTRYTVLLWYNGVNWTVIGA